MYFLLRAASLSPEMLTPAGFALLAFIVVLAHGIVAVAHYDWVGPPSIRHINSLVAQNRVARARTRLTNYFSDAAEKNGATLDTKRALLARMATALLFEFGTTLATVVLAIAESPKAPAA